MLYIIQVVITEWLFRHFVLCDIIRLTIIALRLIFSDRVTRHLYAHVSLLILTLSYFPGRMETQSRRDIILSLVITVLPCRAPFNYRIVCRTNTI